MVTYGMSRQAGAILLAVWASLLLAVIWVRSATSYDDVWIQPLHWFESFYRIGSLIYGGGQVRTHANHLDETFATHSQQARFLHRVRP
ncbi:MAG: hypothetical protein HC767_04250 [Akkermansiaceae bacterium]|nr:hypothetical protein [Akkermansiaceae bacterium]